MRLERQVHPYLVNKSSQARKILDPKTLTGIGSNKQDLMLLFL